MELNLDPRRTALVNVDMQGCFVEGSPLSSPEGPALVARINELARACREAGASSSTPGAGCGPTGRTSAASRSSCRRSSSTSTPRALRPPNCTTSLDVDTTDVVLNKPRYGAFHGTDLETILRSRGIDTVIISGIATNICCDTTAREASQRDYRVVFLSDGTATKEMNGVPAAELQRATLASLAMVFARIATVDQVTTALQVGQRESASV